MDNPVPANLPDFIVAAHKNVYTAGYDASRPLKSLEFASQGSNIGELTQILAVHDPKGASTLTITVVNVSRESIKYARRTLDGVIIALLRTFPIKFIKENVITDNVAWVNLDSKVGWAVYAPVNLLEHVKGFDGEEFFPGFLRIRSVEEVFDVTNPEHAQRALALSRELDRSKAFAVPAGLR